MCTVVWPLSKPSSTAYSNDCCFCCMLLSITFMNVRVYVRLYLLSSYCKCILSGHTNCSITSLQLLLKVASYLVSKLLNVSSLRKRSGLYVYTRVALSALRSCDTFYSALPQSRSHASMVSLLTYFPF